MSDRGARIWYRKFILILLLCGVLGEPDLDVVTHPPPAAAAAAEVKVESRDLLDVVVDDEDLDGRSAYVNNQFISNDPVEVGDDEQNAPLYEILQKQMEQVLASTGPDVPIYEQKPDDSKSPRGAAPPAQQLPTRPPLFSQHNQNDPDIDDDYDDEEDTADQNYGDAEKPDPATTSEDDDNETMPETGYQTASQLAKPSSSSSASSSSPPSSSSFGKSSSTTRRPHRRRSTTTFQPKTTRYRNSGQPKATTNPPSQLNPFNQTNITNPSMGNLNNTSKPKPHMKPQSQMNLLNSLPHDPQIYQHKRRIIFKTISTGSQFVNSPIGDLMIKFSIGFAKPQSSMGLMAPSSEALRNLSNNLLRNIELQKLKRSNKIQRH